MKIVTASNRQDVFEKNLGASERPKDVHITICEDSDFNIPRMYNYGIQNNHITIYCHDDVFLPSGFWEVINFQISILPDNWAVCGVAGASIKDNNRVFKGHIRDRGKTWGVFFKKPEPVQTLDELLIIVNPRAELKFDEQFPLDFYAADLCLQAHSKGLGVYVIPAYVYHNSSRKVGERTPSFYESEKKLRDKWISKFPMIVTTCSIIK